jgi:hypothetical protein
MNIYFATDASQGANVLSSNSWSGSQRNWMWGYELDSSDSRLNPLAGSCKHGNEPLDSIKVRNFLITWYTTNFSRKNVVHFKLILWFLSLIYVISPTVICINWIKYRAQKPHLNALSWRVKKSRLIGENILINILAQVLCLFYISPDVQQ